MTLCAHMLPVAAVLKAEDVHTDYLACPHGLWTWDGNTWTLEPHPAAVPAEVLRAQGIDGQAHCLHSRAYGDISGRTEPLVLRCDKPPGHGGRLHHDRRGAQWYSSPADD